MRPASLSATVSWFARKPRFGRKVRWLGFLLVLFATAAGGSLVLFRTPVGLDIVGRSVAWIASEPGIRIEISGLGGNVPFDFSARRVTLSDANGVWLTAEEVHVEIALGRLLGGRLHVTELTVAKLDMNYVPDIPPDSEAEPWSERLRIPTLPITTTVDRFAIDRIVFAEKVLGERIAATAIGQAVSRDDTVDF
jgi:translocation and assembly module TamB